MLIYFRDKKGKNVRDIIFKNCCDISTNFVPASNNPLATGPQNTPNSNTEKAL